MHRTSSPALRGFTLIELLTVIAIIGILAAIIIPTVGKVRQTASKAAMTSNLRQLGAAVSTFAADNRDSLPGRYVRGTDAGGWNDSFTLGTGQTAYANYSGSGTEPRASIQSIDQLGRYVTRNYMVVDGVGKLYCKLLESPAFASQRPGGIFPNSIELGGTVMSSNGALVYPFGNKGQAVGSMKVSSLVSAIDISRRWMAVEIDKTTPSTIDPTIKQASWYSALPDVPVHGSGWLAVFYDGHVDFMKSDDPRLNNQASL